MYKFKFLSEILALQKKSIFLLQIAFFSKLEHPPLLPTTITCFEIKRFLSDGLVEDDLRIGRNVSLPNLSIYINSFSDSIDLNE
jgi:hypothetical protein